MHWKFKAHVLAAVSRLPKGEQVYHLGQRMLGTNRLNAPEAVQRTLEIATLISGAGGRVEGSVCLEVGTGWRPFLPFVLHLLGAERITTWDVHPWLTKAYADETSEALSGFMDEIAEHAGASSAVVRKRHQLAGAPAKSLEDRLNRYCVEYRCPGDASNTHLPAESVDIVCSTNVLEHVRPDVLKGIHRESRRILAPMGLAVHRIDPSDHFRLCDRSITASNFVQFSSKDWRWLGGSGLSYHNRLRCIEHRELMEAEGFEVLTDRRRRDDKGLREIQQLRLPVHEEFSRFTPEELAECHISLAARPAEPVSISASQSRPETVLGSR